MNLTSLFRRWGAGLLAAALLGSAVPALAVESEDTGSLFQPDSSQQVTAYAPDERVRIVIELEDAPLLDSHKVSQYASVTDFLDSNAAQSTERKLERARKAVKSQLATKLDRKSVV